MFLKKLLIFGFKSFGEKVELELPMGVTAVVGPNGCGKSNLLEAVRWVLGDSSAKSFRGGKMVDVIFSGTEKRKALSFAEVVLTIDNADSSIPLPFSEIEIKRRLERSGESSYFLNREQVRLKDIDNLFLMAGHGNQALFTFEQGKVDQVVVSSPQERRALFEDATGITPFIQKKKETLRKMQDTKQNLNRLKDVVDELQKQEKHLADQALKAKEFKEKRELLKTLHEEEILYRYHQILLKEEEVQKKKSALQEDLSRLEEKEHTLREEEVSSKQELQEKEIAFQKAQEEVYHAKSDQALLQNRYSESKREKEKISLKIKEFSQQQQTTQTLLEKEKETQKGELLKKETLEKNLQELESKDTKKSEIEQWEKDLLALNQREILFREEKSEITKKRVELEGEKKGYEIRLEHGIKQVDSGKKELDLLKQENDKLQETSKTTSSKKESLEKELKTSLKEEENTKKELERLRKEKERLDTLEKITLSELKEKKGRFDVLDNLKKEKEGYSKGAKKLLDLSRKKESPLFGEIFEFVELAEKKDSLFKRMFQGFGSALTLKKSSLLDEVLNTLSEDEKEGVILFLEDQVEKNFFKKLNTYVKEVSSLQEIGDTPHSFMGKELYRGEYPFLLLKPSGKDLFSREEERKTLLEILENKKLELEQIVQQKKELETTLFTQEKELQKIFQVINQHKNEIHQSERALSHIAQELERGTRKQKELSAMVERHQKEKAHYQELFEKTEKEFSKIQQQETKTQENLQTLLKEKEVLSLKLKEEKTKHLQHEKHLSDTKLTLLNLQHEIDVRNIKISERAHEIQFFQKEIDKLVHEEKEVETLFKEIESNVHSTDEVLLKKVKLFEQQEKALLKVKDSLSKELQKKEVLDKEKQKKLQDIARFEGEEGALQLEKEEFKEISPRESYPTKSAKQTISALEKELETFEDVNLAADHDLEALKERESLITKEVNEVEQTEQSLLLLIQELEEESKKKFLEGFQKIREKFHHFFQTLFLGGRSDLILNSANPLEGGIDIIAEPPGKKMKSIQLLSGGEKCLTAMSLLFAIFSIKPSPFCILDEVDASLDETNVGRFTQILAEFKEKTQFFMITHNKKTMTSADRLVGVTCPEKGVSKIVEMRFHHANSTV